VAEVEKATVVTNAKPVMMMLIIRVSTMERYANDNHT
jgi:hypothetical protein